MALDASVFRHRCGLFAPILAGIMYRKACASRRNVRGFKVRTMAAGLSVGLLVSLFFWNGLALAGDVESNPGPVSGGRTGAITSDSSSPPMWTGLCIICQRKEKRSLKRNSRLWTRETLTKPKVCM